MPEILVLSPGGWGSAMAIMLHRHGAKVKIWGKYQAELDEIRQTGKLRLLKGIEMPYGIELTSDMSAALSADIIISAVPSFAVRETMRALKPYYKGQKLVNIGKGLEEDSLLRLSEVIYDEIPEAKLAVMSGPSHAEEVARGMPTVNVVASKDEDFSNYIQQCVMNENFRIYTSDDIIGIELGGALKNVIALAAGISDGLGAGDNAKAALMTRGITEIARLGVKMGGRRETFSGLAGFGDLIVTCTSMHSRNRRCGILIGQGMKASDAVREIGMTVEGYKTSSAAYKISRKYQVEMPIITEIYNVLYMDKSPKEAIYDLMSRKCKSEHEELWDF